jgi:TonB family protein
MTAIAQALTSALLHFLWQGLLVALILWGALFLLRKRSANSRYLAACVALALLTLAPVVTTGILYTQAASAPSASIVAPSPAHQAHAAQDAPGTPRQAWIGMVESWALPCWSVGVLLFSFRLVWGCRQVSALRRRGEPASPSLRATVAALARRLGVAQPVRLLITAAQDSPSVVGWIRPVILIPSATLLGLTTEQLEAVLSHELAHIRRHDYLVNVLQILVETLLFYHPAVWWTSRRIRHERELCCDDLAVGSCGDALCYARALTKLERLRITTPALALGSSGGSMLYRIERLVGARSQEYGPSKLTGILAMTLALSGFALNLHWARGQQQESPARTFHFTTATDRPGVTVDLAGASVIHRSPVEYPRPALEQAIQGTVVVEATLDGAGEVDDARVVSGPAELRRVSLQSVLQWHFAPATAGAVRQVSIHFDASAAQAEERKPATHEFHDRGFAYTAGELESGRQAHIAQLEAQIEESKAQLAQSQAMLAQGSDKESQYKSELIREQKLVTDLESALESQRAAGLVSHSITVQGRTFSLRVNSAVGRVLRRLDVVGLPETVQKELAARIPVHIGDTITHELMEKTTDAIASFDGHLEFNYSEEDGPYTTLRITAPDGAHWRIREK